MSQIVKCPECKTDTYRVILAGKQALCINSKCPIQKFTVQDFVEGESNKHHKDKGKENKSYNNSGRKK